MSAQIMIEELGRDEAISFLRGTTLMWPLIEYKGRWLRYGRTDLKDNVATFPGHPLEDAVERCLGIRVYDDALFVIDRYSDG